MIIPESTRNVWAKLRSQGDITEMAENNASKRVQISNAINGKTCTEEIFILIRDFYRERARLLKTV